MSDTGQSQARHPASGQFVAAPSSSDASNDKSFVDAEVAAAVAAFKDPLTRRRPGKDVALPTAMSGPHAAFVAPDAPVLSQTQMQSQPHVTTSEVSHDKSQAVSDIAAAVADMDAFSAKHMNPGQPNPVVDRSPGVEEAEGVDHG